MTVLPATPLRVLIVDDEPTTLRFVRSRLIDEGYRLSTAHSGRSALKTLRKGATDLVVLELDLPDIDGLDVIAHIRGDGSIMPIIVVSSRSEERSKVTALDLGADDYLAKPFGVEELVARVRVAQRHRLAREGDPPVFRAGDLTVDLLRRIVRVRGKEVTLSPREYDLLCLLVRHAGKVLPHDFILREVWGPGTDIQYLRIYICALRRKTEGKPHRPIHILTEVWVGYRLRGRLSAEKPAAT
jgi:two-component system KDP operon response regulator KdpE